MQSATLWGVTRDLPPEQVATGVPLEASLQHLTLAFLHTLNSASTSTHGQGDVPR